MKIGFITTRFYPVGGGAGTVSRIIAERLSKSFRTDVLTESEDFSSKTEKFESYLVRRLGTTREESITKHLIFSLKSSLLSNLYDIAYFQDVTSSFFSFLCFRKKILKYGGDVIYEYLMLREPELRLTDVPKAWEYNGFTKTMKAFVKTYMKLFDMIYANSEYGKSCLRLLGIDAKVVRNGVDTRYFSPPTKKEKVYLKRRYNLEGKRVFFVASRLVPWKGIDIAIKAFVKTKEKDWIMLIAGHGPYAKVLESIGRGKGVRFLGNLRREVVRDYLRLCDVFVHIPYMDWCPNALLEAMACGNNVVSTIYGGLKEIVNDRNAFVVEKINEASVAKQMREAIREYRGESARKTVERKFSLDGMIKNIRSIIDSV